MLLKSKRKLGETTHFSEIIELQFGKISIHCFVFSSFLDLICAESWCRVNMGAGGIFSVIFAPNLGESFLSSRRAGRIEIAQKNVPSPMLLGIDFSRNIVVLKIVAANFRF